MSAEREGASTKSIVVYGATGHTGRFVVAELQRRGWSPIVAGRDRAKLETVVGVHESSVRPASLDDPESLDEALSGASAVINCAGPFLDAAVPVIEAALRGGTHYLDVTAEQAAVLLVNDRFGGVAQDTGIVIAPAVGFFGALADLLATAAMGDWPVADEIRTGVALDSWHPTRGTRLTGKRNTSRRLVVSSGDLKFLPEPAPTRTWEFPPPFGTTDVVALPLSEIMTISSHLKASEIQSYMNLAAVNDVRDPGTPGPAATDERGRSSQIFTVDVLVRRGREQRRATAQGRDIYAITAPIVVEAAERIVMGRVSKRGIASPGSLFDPIEFLNALAPDHLSIQLQQGLEYPESA